MEGGVRGTTIGDLRASSVSELAGSGGGSGAFNRIVARR